MSTSLSQEKLEEMVVGKSPNPNAVFFEQAVLNVPRSHENGRRMYDKKVYVKLSQPGIADSISYAAQSGDIEKYPDEYTYFLNNKQGARQPGIEIIPNLDIAHLQELRDYGILTIPKLAEMEIVPPHLEYAHRAALIFNAALKETSNAEQEESIEENTIQNNGGSEEFTFRPKGVEITTESVPEADRHDNRADVRRCAIPASIEDSADRRSARRDDKGGREQRHNPVGTGSIDNWSIELTL